MILQTLAIPAFSEPQPLPPEGRQILLQGLLALKEKRLAEAIEIANALYRDYPDSVDSYQMLVNVAFISRDYGNILMAVRTAESRGIRDSELYLSAASAAYLLRDLGVALKLLADYEEAEFLKGRGL